MKNKSIFSSDEQSSVDFQNSQVLLVTADKILATIDLTSSVALSVKSK